MLNELVANQHHQMKARDLLLSIEHLLFPTGTVEFSLD
jgi:hypothetical protein